MTLNIPKAGALDFVEKPIDRDELLASITRVLEQPHDGAARQDSRKIALERRRGGARFVTDISLLRRPARRRVLDWWLRRPPDALRSRTRAA